MHRSNRLDVFSVLLGACAIAALTSAPRAQLFASARHVPQAEATETRLVAFGHLDADAHLDFVAVRRFSPLGFHVMLGDGAGGVTAGPLTEFPVGWTVPSTGNQRGQLVDVTGDGVPDVLQPYSGGGAHLAVYAGDGLGGFAAPSSTLLGGNSYRRFALADVSGDAAYEIAAAVYDTTTDEYTLGWWSWDGAMLVGSAAVVLPGLNFDDISELAAADVDGDGIADLVVSFDNTNTLSVYRTKSGAPTTPPLSIEVPLPGLPGFEVHAADADGDGDDDLLAVRSDRIRPVLLESGAVTLGPTSTLEPLDFESYTGPPSMVDWNDDGHVDLLRHSENTDAGFGAWPYLGVFLNGGQHGYALAARYRTDEPGGGAGLADVDGDGRADFVAPHAFVLGDGTARTAPLRTVFGGFPALNTGGIALRDVDGDGDLDIMESEGNLLPDDGTGSYSTDPDDVIDVWPLVSPHGIVDTLALDDFTGDGRPDMLVRRSTLPTDVKLYLVPDDGTGHYVDVLPAAAAGLDSSVPGDHLLWTSDVDGDGDRDVLDHDGYWTNDGSGYLDAFVPEYTGSVTDVGDVDGDGDEDLLFVRNNGLVQVRRNLGGGDFSNPLNLGPFADLEGHGSYVDLDQDGDLDIVAAEGLLGSGAVHLLRNDGWPTWTGATLAGWSRGAGIFGVDDVDGDGVPDLLAAARFDTVVYGPPWGPSEPKVQVFRGIDPAALSYAPVEIYAGGATLAFVDVDQDGDLDAAGVQVVDSRRFDGPADGSIRQYGAGVAGTGGAVPLLGGTGPFRVGSTTAGLRVRNAVGGAPLFLLVGTDRAQIPGLFLGGTLWVAPLLLTVQVPLPGTPGEAGAGALDLSLTGVLDVLAGVTITLQAVALDPGAAVGKSSTGGLEIVFGN